MRKYLYGLLAALALVTPAAADWTAKNATSATITFKNPNDCTSVVCVPVVQLYDGTNLVTLTTAGADAASNTLTGVPTYARLQIYNGATWDRWQGGIKAASGAIAAGAGVDGWDLTQGAKADSVCATDTGTCSLVALVKRTNQQVTAGQITVGTAGTPSTQVLSVQGIASMTPIATNQTQVNGSTLSATNPSFAAPIPTTSGGLSVYNVQPTASDNHAVIKAGAGQVYKVDAFNNSAVVNYIRLYNATTGFNGCNSATNIVWQGIIPASTSGAGLSSSWDLGIAFTTGISICVTSGYAQTDTTNATASALIVNVGFK